MAPALSSNAFRVSTGLYSKPDSKTLRPTVTVYARTGPLGIGKPKAEPSEGENPEEGSGKPNKFFKLGEIPDARSLIAVTSPLTALFPSPGKDPNTVFVDGATRQFKTGIA